MLIRITPNHKDKAITTSHRQNVQEKPQLDRFIKTVANTMEADYGRQM